MNKLDLQKHINTTPHTISKIVRDENVSMDILGRICRCFKCDILEVLEYKINFTSENDYNRNECHK